MNDWELLQSWAEQRSESAFAELTRRHLNLVLSSALRQVRNPELARDVCQAVFLALARKAGSIRRNVVISGWLFRATCYIAARALRAEGRRQRHESEAATMNHLLADPNPPSESWTEIAPHLDAALASLPSADRDALVLRYLESQPLRVVGERLGITEEAAKKRASRAVEKLRALLGKRGVAVTAVVLGKLLSEIPAEAASTDLAGAITAGAVSGSVPVEIGSLASGGTSDLLVARLKELAPLAAAISLMIIGTVAWLRHDMPESPSSPPLARPAEVVSQNVATAAPVASAVRREPGPAKLILSVKSAGDNSPIQAQIRANIFSLHSETAAEDFTTDPNGIVEIPVAGSATERLTVWVSAAGFVPIAAAWQRHEFVEPEIFHTVRLQRGNRLEGMVRNEMGEPVGGAKVTINGPSNTWGERESVVFHSRLSSVQTDKDGHFQLDQLPIPTDSQSLTCSIQHEDYVRETIVLRKPEALTTQHQIVLKKGFKVRGKVVDVDDQPMSNIEVEENHHRMEAQRETRTDATGLFELGPFAAGKMELLASAKGFDWATVRFEVNEAATNLVLKLVPSENAALSWLQGTDNNPTVRVAGTVVDDETGKPVPHFRVRKKETGRLNNDDFLGEGYDGRFDWPIRMSFEREFSLEVEANGYAPSKSDKRTVQPDMENSFSFEFRLKHSTELAGYVLGPDGQPAVNAFVGLNGLGFGCRFSEGCRAMSNSDAPETTTDANGRFSFRPRTGVESVLVAHEFGTALVLPEQLQKGPVILQRWGAIEGVVLVGGKPASSQEVALTWAEGLVPEGTLVSSIEGTARTDSDGRFRFAKVPSGPVSVCRYFNFNRNRRGSVGMSRYSLVVVPAGGVAEVTIGSQGRMITGRLALNKPLSGHDWRDDLQSLIEAGMTQPVSRAQPHTPEWRKEWRALNRFWATLKQFFLELRPDGAFLISDVPPGNYTLQLTVAQPPGESDTDMIGNPITRRQIGGRSVEVVVPEADPNEPLDLGTITIPLD
jgi:RNA polymerase sigma factor (sigma-70 family)